ncbi:MAG: alpha-L-fucosidase, partial [Bacteroidales bacterium]|nr:alpha-L-fucosidase [Bacteroidales bacterium]
GMFIHWGLYSVPAGEWEDSKNHAEWIRTTAQIPLETYNQFINKFNPTLFDASAWVKMAKDAGMKYIVITSKHHDGFCLWDSKQTDFDIMSTPYERDLLKELADECKKEGIKLCWYHSIMDWHHPDYLPRRGWETKRSEEGAVFDDYVSYMKKQLKELLSNYGEIGVLWFDGEWEKTWTDEYGTDLYHYVRSLQPDIIINNRVGVGRAGMAGLSEEGVFGGDFGTPEQQIPATGLPDTDWETCMTMNGHWGFNRVDKNFKSTEDLIHKLSDIASKGGNFLLNIGPTAEGLFPQESIDRMRDIGIWMRKNSDAIYGTQASPFKNLKWGRCTQKPMEESTRLYLHVFDYPENGVLKVPGLGNETIRAFMLEDQQEENLIITKERDGIYINIPHTCPDSINTVIILDIVGTPVVYEPPLIISDYSEFTDYLDINIQKKEDASTIRYSMDGSMPTVDSPIYNGSLKIVESSTLTACCFLNGVPISDTSSQIFQKVKPFPGRHLSGLKPGLKYNYYEGEWNRIPNYNGLIPKKQGVAENFDLASKEDEENFSIDYQGLLKIEKGGVYRFYLSSDDGSKLILGDQVVINHDGLHGPAEASGEIALGEGMHAIRISFFENSGGNMLRLEWTNQDFEKQIINKELLFHIR